MGDGAPVPRGDGPIKEKVERYYQSREQMCIQLPDIPETPEYSQPSAVFAQTMNYPPKVDNRMSQKDDEIRRLQQRLGLLEEKLAASANSGNSAKLRPETSNTEDWSAAVEQLTQAQSRFNNLVAANPAVGQFLETRSSAKNNNSLQSGF